MLGQILDAIYELISVNKLVFQFDWYGWIPNSPSTMRKPPPQEKGKVDLHHIMDTLPDRDCSIDVLGTVWGLSRFQDEVWHLIYIYIPLEIVKDMSAALFK